MAESAVPVMIFRDGPPAKKMPGELLRLLVVQGPNQKTCYCLSGDGITIGRESCTITLSDQSVSRKHVQLNLVNNRYVAKDLGSANAFIHNKQKTAEATLNVGDVLIIGLTVFDILAPGALAKKSTAKQEDPAERKRLRDEQSKIAKNKMLIIGAVLFFLYIAFSPSDEKQTFRDASKIVHDDETAAPAQKTEKQKREQKEALEGLKEYTPDYSIKGTQRKDAQVFFRNGMRELQNKNFRRAVTAFETALTVDPSHDMAKRYLTIARKDFEEEIKSTFMAASQARKAMRYTEARMNYENILRYLEGDTLNKTLIEAQEALKQMDKEENRNND